MNIIKCALQAGGIGIVGFYGGGKTQEPREKPSEQGRRDRDRESSAIPVPPK